ncbi:MAG: hypothetical protein BMS9Abin11_0538 [Gammaproteobacteria bacterium]|nr:MAG: hypothetical protein BMS9Abin11_0538 [Gammaproteobacteria bacterium]
MVALLPLFLPLFGQQSQHLAGFLEIAPGLFRSNAAMPTIIYIQIFKMIYYIIWIWRKNLAAQRKRQRDIRSRSIAEM